jgi:membrane associated rhomboid family serine protease
VSSQQLQFNFPKPSRPVAGLMIVIGCLWVMFAVALNWGDAGIGAFALFAGSSEALAGGQVWRLVTAALIHSPRNPMHALSVILMLYFFAPPLEERWGTKRLFAFLAGAAALSFSVQSIANLIAPSVAPTSTWHGGMGMAEAAAVAWAFGARKQVVRLFFLIPVTPMVMVGLFAAWSVLSFIVRNPSPEGMVTPLAALGAGYLLCDSSPLRQYYLKLRLHRIQSEVDTMTKRRSRAATKKRAAASNLRVIPGGANDDDDAPPKGGTLH